MENLGIDYKLLIAQVINFAILFFIFRRFMAKPFMKMIKDERKKEEEKNRLEEEVKTKHARMLEEEQVWRKRIKNEQEKILDETRKEAEKLKAELSTNARTEAEDIVTRAKKQIEEERENFYKEVRKYITDTSILIVQQALKKYLTTDMQRHLTGEVISNLKKDKYEN